MKAKSFTVLLALAGLAIILLLASAAVLDRVGRSYVAQGGGEAAGVQAEADIPTDVITGSRIGNLGPDFTLNATNGSQINLKDFRGKPVILNFWATWCGPCQFEMPFLKAIDEEWSKAGVTIIAISTQDLPDNAISYTKAKDLKFLVPLDPLGKVAGLYKVRGMPTTFFINEEGIITSVKVGPFISVADIESHMASFKSPISGK